MSTAVGARIAKSKIGLVRTNPRTPGVEKKAMDSPVASGYTGRNVLKRPFGMMLETRVRQKVMQILSGVAVFAFVAFCAMFSAEVRDRNGAWRPVSDRRESYQFEEQSMDLFDWLERYMESRDANGDGHLSFDEARSEGMYSEDRIEAWFAEVDGDGDEAISLLEMADWSEAMEARADALRDIFARLDGDGDGMLRREEYTATHTLALPLFDDADYDFDGAVTERELQSALRFRPLRSDEQGIRPGLYRYGGRMR